MASERERVVHLRESTIHAMLTMLRTGDLRGLELKLCALADFERRKELRVGIDEVCKRRVQAIRAGDMETEHHCNTLLHTLNEALEEVRG